MEKQKGTWRNATDNAKRILRRGDRIRCTRCGGIKRTYTFECWDGYWIMSKSGIDDLAATNIDMLNGKPVDFSVC